MSSNLRAARWLGIALLLVGYPVLAHYTNVHVQNATLGALVAVAPASVIGLMLALQSSPRWAWLSLFALAGVAGAAGWTVLEGHFGVLYWLQDAGMQCVLLLSFARTLLAGRKPLCTHFAELAHGALTPQHAHYTRRITWAWAVFFGLMATVSTLLFFLAPLTVWSVFANFLTLPLVALMFVLEYGVRRTVLPAHRHGSILATFRVWKEHGHSNSSAAQVECHS